VIIPTKKNKKPQYPLDVNGNIRCDQLICNTIASIGGPMFLLDMDKELTLKTLFRCDENAIQTATTNEIDLVHVDTPSIFSIQNSTSMTSRTGFLGFFFPTPFAWS
jgi:hypothetical protein